MQLEQFPDVNFPANSDPGELAGMHGPAAVERDHAELCLLSDWHQSGPDSPALLLTRILVYTRWELGLHSL